MNPLQQGLKQWRTDVQSATHWVAIMNPLQQGLKPTLQDLYRYGIISCNNESTTTRIETCRTVAYYDDIDWLQ